MDRYKRNIGTLTLEESEKIKNSKVCVIGCGGLGGNTIQMLARIGVGYITIVDDDNFDESNLNRQIFCKESNLGQSKVKSVKKQIEDINSEVNIIGIEEFVDENNMENIIKEHDVVVDGLDSIKSRFILQSICKKLDIILVYGAINSWYGQVSTIYPGDNTLNYIYKKDITLNNKASNPSFTPCIISGIQVSECIKVLLNKGQILRKKLLILDLLNNDYDIIEIKQ